jgi:hypothetical protein
LRSKKTHQRINLVGGTLAQINMGFERHSLPQLTENPAPVPSPASVLICVRPDSVDTHGRSGIDLDRGKAPGSTFPSQWNGRARAPTQVI